MQRSSCCSRSAITPIATTTLYRGSGRRSTARDRRPWEPEGQHRTIVDGAPGEFRQVVGDRASFDDRVAPVVQADHLREQLGAEAVSVATDPVDLEDLAHQATATRCGLATVRQPRRWCSAKSSANSCRALRINPTAPSG